MSTEACFSPYNYILRQLSKSSSLLYSASGSEGPCMQILGYSHGTNANESQLVPLRMLYIEILALPHLQAVFYRHNVTQ